MKWSYIFLGDISSPDLAKRIFTFEVEVGATFSIYYICLCIILNNICPAYATGGGKSNLRNAMECIRRSIMNQYPPKAVDVYPSHRRQAKLPYSFLAEMRKVFQRAISCEYKAQVQPQKKCSSGKSRARKSMALARVVTIVVSGKGATLTRWARRWL